MGTLPATVSNSEQLFPHSHCIFSLYHKALEPTAAHITHTAPLPPAPPYLVQVGELLVLDEHFLVGKLPPAQQASQLVPVSQLVVVHLGLPLLLLALCWWVGRWQPLRLFLLFLLLFVVTVSSVLSQKTYQRVHHLGLREEAEKRDRLSHKAFSAKLGSASPAL